MRTLIVLCALCMAYESTCQSLSLDQDFSVPYRPRIAEFNVTNLAEYNTASESEQFGRGDSEIERDRLIKVRLGIPVIMKDNLLFGLQLKYDNHDFALELPDYYELYNHIERETFRSYGGRFFLQKDIAKNKRIAAVIGTEIKSDENEWAWNSTRTYASFTYKVDKTQDKTIGFGLFTSYTLERFQVYPILYYEKDLSRRWTLDLALPKSATLRYRASPKCFVSAIAVVRGWRYAVNNELLAQETLTLRKSDLQLGIRFEHEIHDWLWLGMDAGYSQNLRNFLSRPGDRRRDAIVHLNPTNTSFINFGIFIVPPRKIYKK